MGFYMRFKRYIFLFLCFIVCMLSSCSGNKDDVIKHTITFDTNSEVVVDSIEVEDGFGIDVPTNIERVGYSFVGWYLDYELTVPYNSSIRFNRDYTLYGKWKVKELDINIYIEGLIEKTIKRNYGDVLDSIEVVNRYGYTFDGYYLDENLTKPLDKGYVIKDTLNLYTKWNINSYVIKTVIDGTETNSYTLVYGTKLTTIEKPIKEHYTFDGWYSEANYKTKYTSFATAMYDTTLYARFIPDDISVKVYDGENLLINKTYKYDQLISSIKIEDVTGYTFEGLYYDAEKTKKVSSTDTFTGDVTLYVNRIVNVYKVQLVVNGDIVDTLDVYHDSLITSIMIPSVAHHTFKGWYDKDYTVKYSDDFKITSDIILYALYETNTYNVKIYSFGEVIHDKSYPYNTLLSSITLMPLPGHSFEHFIFKNSTNIVDPNYIIESDLELEIVWKINKYKISIYLDNILTSDEEYEYNYLISNIKKPVKEHYTFDGWYTDETYQSKIDNMEQLTSDLELYGRFNLIKLNVNLYSDNVLYRHDEVVHGTKISSIALPTKFGHTVDGLYKDSSFSIKFDDNEEITIDTDIYVKWKINQYKVKIVIDDVLYTTVDVDYNTRVIDIVKPNKEHHNFIGYFDSLGKMIDEDELVTGDMTIYGKFELVDLKVSIYDGKTLVSTKNVKYGDKLNLVSAPNKSGYTFICFYSDDAFYNELSLDYVITDNINIYAKFDINKYSVRLFNGSVYYKTITVEYGTKVSSIEKPTKTNYHFVNWYGEASFTNVVASSSVISSNLDLYAKFEIDKYNVKYYDGSKLLKTISVNYGTKFSTIAKPTKTGYTLVKMYSDSSYTTEMDANLTLYSDIIVYTTWNINTYVVNIYYDSVLQSTETITYGTKVSSFVKPTKEHHTFTWYSDSAYKNKVSDSHVISQNMNLYGCFSIEQIKINYYDNTKLLSSIYVDYNSLLKDAKKPSKTGYSLVDLYTDKELTKPVNLDSYVVLELNIYTKWLINQYNVNVYYDGKLFEAVKVNYNTLISSITKLPKEHHNVLGWYSDVECKNLFNINAMVTKNINIYAMYELVDVKVLVYSDNKLFNTFILKYGDNISSITKPTKTGYTFNCFALDAKLENTVDDNYIVTGDISLYAKYDINKYKVSIIVDGVVYEERSIEYATKIIDIEEPKRTDHLFMGFYDDVSLQKPTSNDRIVTKDMVIYTKWMNISNITYKINYYHQNLSDDEYTLINTVTKADYLNKVVYADILPYIGFTVEDENIFGKVLLDGTLTLSVYYKRNIHKVTYLYDNLVYKTEYLKYGSKYKVISDNLIDGYIFKGWYSDESYQTLANISLIKDVDEVVYALVEKIDEGTSDIVYELNSDGESYSAVAYNGSDTRVIVPNGYLHYPVTSIKMLSSTVINEIIVGKYVTKIHDEAFVGCDNLISVSLPDSLISIGFKSFAMCEKLKDLSIPQNVSSIGLGAFFGCKSLESINVSSDNVTYKSVEGVLFDFNLTTLLLYPSSKLGDSYTIPSSVSIIGRLAFIDVSNLRSIDVSGIQEILPENFISCTNMERIIFGEVINYISDTILIDMPNLKEIIVDNNNASYTSIDGVLYNKEMTELIKYPSNKVDERFEVPKTVEVIKYKAFDNCVNLNTLIIKDNVYYLESNSINSRNTTIIIYSDDLLSISSKNAIVSSKEIKYEEGE